MPIFYGTIPECLWAHTTGNPSEQEWHDFLHTFATFTGSVHFSCIYRAAALNAEQRAELGDVLNGPVGQRLTAIVIATDSSLIRGVGTAVNWIAKSKNYVQKMFAHPRDSLRWIEDKHPNIFDSDLLRKTMAENVPAEMKWPDWPD